MNLHIHFAGAISPVAATTFAPAGGGDANNRPAELTEATSLGIHHHESEQLAQTPFEEEIVALHITSPPIHHHESEQLAQTPFEEEIVALHITSPPIHHHESEQLAQTPFEEEIVALHITSPPMIPALPDTDRVFLGGLGVVMNASPSPSLTPRRYRYTPPPLIVPAATTSAGSSSTISTTTGTATPILLPRAMSSSSATHHQQPHDDSVAPTSIVASTSSLLLPVGAPNSSTPPRATKSASLPRVLYATPIKTKGEMATLLHARVPGAPEKKKAGPDEVFYYERHVKTRRGQQQVPPAISGSSQSVISRELLVVAEQELMEVGINACTKTNTRECSLPTHNSSPGTLAMAATAEEPTQMSPMSSRPTMFEAEEERSSQLKDNLMTALEAAVPRRVRPKYSATLDKSTCARD